MLTLLQTEPKKLTPKQISQLLQHDQVFVDPNNKCLISVQIKQPMDGVYQVTPRIQPVNGRGEVVRTRKPDDDTYSNYPDMQRYLARCQDYLYVGDMVFIMTGPYKFTGETKNEEDDEMDMHNGLYTHAPLTEADRVIVSRKANGKCAIMRFVEIGGVDYMWCGSKSQHYLFRTGAFEEDWENCPVDLVKGIARAFWNQVQGCLDELKPLLNGNCLVAEYEDGMHLEPLLGEEPRVVAFQIVESRPYLPPSESYCHDLVQTVEQLQSLGIQTVEIDVLDQIADKSVYRLGRNEGYVLLWQKEWQTTRVARSARHTIALEKFKTYAYVLTRAVREWMGRNDTVWDQEGHMLCGWEHSLLLMLLGKEFLGLPDTMMKVWFDYFVQFIGWFISKGYGKGRVGHGQDSVGMGNVVQEFEQETGVTCDFCHQPWEEVIQDLEPVQYNRAEIRRQLQTSRTVLEQVEAVGTVYLMSGTVGCGKNTIGHELPGVLLDQDQFRTENCPQNKVQQDIKAAGKKCRGKFLELLKQGTDIVLARNNFCNRDIHFYREEAKKAGFRVIHIVPDDLVSALTACTCFCSVLERARDDIAKEQQLVLVFMALTEDLEGMDGRVVYQGLDMVEVPAGVDEVFQADLAEVKAQGFEAFAGHGLDNVMERYRLDQIDYLSLRRDPVQIKAEIMAQVQEIPMVVTRTPPPSPYLGVFFTKQENKKLPVKCSQPHVTCVHPKQHPPGTELYDQMLTQVDEPVQVVAYGRVQRDGFDGLAVRLQQDGVDVSGWVTSGVPHITMKAPKGKAYEMARLIGEGPVELLDQEIIMAGQVRTQSTQ